MRRLNTKITTITTTSVNGERYTIPIDKIEEFKNDEELRKKEFLKKDVLNEKKGR